MIDLLVWREGAHGEQNIGKLIVMDGVEKSPIETASQHRKSSEFASIFLVTLIVALFLKTFVIEAFRIPTASMEGTLHVGDFLFVNKLAYGPQTPRFFPFTGIEVPHVRFPGLKSPSRGDVVVFEYPGGRDEVRTEASVNYIKRCVAVGGDTVLIRSKRVFVNGFEFPLPATARIRAASDFVPGEALPQMFPAGSPFNPDYYGPIIVPHHGMVLDIANGAIEQWRVFIRREGHQVALREDGSVLVDGLPAVAYTVERDYLFVMGDNRDNSLDSRYWGFVPIENVVGQAMFVYWSWDSSVPLSSVGQKIAAVRWSRIGLMIR